MTHSNDRAFEVIVIGELNADLILNGDVEPAFGQVEKVIDDATLTLGSSSAICACGMARLGLRVAFIGKVGDDLIGRFVLSQLADRHVNTAGVVVDQGVKTGLSVILSRPTDRAILTYSGSIGALRFDEINFDLLRDGRHLHMGSYFMLSTLRPDVPKLFEQARRLGLSVSIDTNYDPNEQWNGNLNKALQHADIFLPNETELRAIAHSEDIKGGLTTLAKQIPTIAVKLGAHGALAQHSDKVVRADALPVNVVDTTGAGDTFDAGFIFGLLRGWDLEKSLRLACVCGSLSTRAAGGTIGQPTLDEAMPYL
jgi:sugar/nucleoside kinase (ribokinase family)